MDRVNELAAYDKPQHPDHRPPYLHLVPLSEIISIALGIGPNTKGVKKEWDKLIERHGSEVAVLVDDDISDSGADERVLNIIMAFREEKVTIHPGGGGQYGRAEFSGTELPKNDDGEPQKSLFDF